MVVASEEILRTGSAAAGESTAIGGRAFASSTSAVNLVPTAQPATNQRSTASLEATARRLLDGVPVPTILIAADRRLVMRNAAAQADPSAIACIGVSYGRATRFAGAATEPFERVFARALNGLAATAVVTLAQENRQALWRVSMGPVRPDRALDDAAVIMVIDPPAAPRGTLAPLQRLFGVTPAEARVLALLLDDCRPREIARQLDVSITTVRSHLKALFAKTGTRRQSELVALAWSAA